MTLPEAGVKPRNLLREIDGEMVVVDGFVEKLQFYEPDCVVYQTARQSHNVFAVCGERTPILVASSMVSGWKFRQDGLHRSAEPELVDGRLVVKTEFVPVDDLRRAALRQPPFRLEWTASAPGVAESLSPIQRAQQVDVDVRGAAGQTPLIRAVANHRTEAVGDLLRAGADVNATADNGGTALMIASSTGQTAVVKRLLDSGADPNLQDKYSRTALMDAAGMGETEIARMLIAAGADATLRDAQGRTARQLVANHSGNPELLELLRRAEKSR